MRVCVHVSKRMRMSVHTYVYMVIFFVKCMHVRVHVSFFLRLLACAYGSDCVSSHVRKCMPKDFYLGIMTFKNAHMCAVGESVPREKNARASTLCLTVGFPRTPYFNVGSECFWSGCIQKRAFFFQRNPGP